VDIIDKSFDLFFNELLDCATVIYISSVEPRLLFLKLQNLTNQLDAQEEFIIIQYHSQVVDWLIYTQTQLVDLLN
jgi:hypothetical protein